ncbi:response regulator transcription factor [Curvibacter gracilis]|uniref:response regulator transcription factor n=1 Tax=Curvibacter gracilis TaxID=230310 RepID=UPI0004800B05|nr:response regulator [Curvibacter gracilis]
MENTVLIVDDEPHIRMLLEESLVDLEDQGISLLSACNGREALQLIEAHRPRLVLLDVMMPELSGYEVCQQVRANPALAQVYILMLTAKGQEADRQRGLEAGADDYATKPFDPDDMLARVQRVLALS